MKVGDYVRTNCGIAKIVKIDKNTVIVDEGIDISGEGRSNHLLKIYIVKSSPNIIDLIEIGDYVNGYLVIDIVKGFKVIIDKLELDTTTGLYYNIGIIDIKSIVTKEQFEEMEYKIDD